MEILHPMLAMMALSATMILVLLSSRLPAIIKNFPNLQGAKHSDELRAHYANTNWRYITDNYNHIFEQPTLFYAICLYIYIAESADDLHIQLAWGYVLLRLVHSIIHISVNNVAARAGSFILSSVCLIGLVGREAISLLSSI